MAKLQLYDTLGEFTQLTDLYAEEEMFLVDESESATGVEFLDLEALRDIVLKGSGFTFDQAPSPDVILTGTVKSIEFQDDEGNLYARIGGLNADAAAIAETLLQPGGIADVLNDLLAGDDKIFGSLIGDYLIFGNGKGDDTIDGDKGEDTIGGGKGKDRLTGGAQNDLFLFYKGDGKDVITDFDAIGGDGKQDNLVRTFESKSEIDIRQDGDNVVIDYGGGSTVTLLDVDRKDFSMADFVTF